MNNNTRGFVALLFLEVIVPMTAPPTTHHPPSTRLLLRAAKQRRNGIAEPRSGWSDGEGERAERWRGGASEQPNTQVYVS